MRKWVKRRASTQCAAVSYGDTALTPHSEHEISTLSSSDWVGWLKRLVPKKCRCVFPLRTACVNCWCLANGRAADFVAAVAAAASEQEQRLAGRWTRTVCVWQSCCRQASNSTIKPYVSPTPGTSHTGCLFDLCVCVHTYYKFVFSHVGLRVTNPC